MTPSRAQLDAAEAWLLEEWRAAAKGSFAALRLNAININTYTDEWAAAVLPMLRDKRGPLAAAIRAIRAQRKASLQCESCGDIITPGTMGSVNCELSDVGWTCGTCIETARPWPTL